MGTDFFRTRTAASSTGRPITRLIGLWLAALASTFVATAAHAIDPFGVLDAVPPVSGLSGPDSASSSAAPCQAVDFGQPLELAEVVDLALCNNPLTRQSWASARYQAAQVGIAQSAYLPTLSATASASRSHNTASRNDHISSQRGVNGNLSWVLFDFGARAASLESARQLFRAAAYTRDATSQNVFLSAVQAYFQRQAAGAALEAVVLAEKSAQEALNAAEARYRVGTATPADRLQAGTAHAQAVLNRISAEGQLKTAQGALAGVLGIEPTQPFSLAPLPAPTADEAFRDDLQQLIDQARRLRPDLAAAEAQYQAAEANIDAARAAHLPTLSLGASAGHNRASGQPAFDNSSIGLTLNIPLFNGFATSYRVHAAEAQAELQSARRDQVRQQVALDVWNAHANLTTATQSVKTARELLDSATQSERVAAGRYRAGVGSILDLLSAQAALASARQSRILAETGWYATRAALAQSIGSLDAGLLTLLAPAATAAPAPSPVPPAANRIEQP